MSKTITQANLTANAEKTYAIDDFRSMVNYANTKNKGYVGFNNYLKIFKKDEYIGAMLLSLYYMAGAVVQLALALFFATLLSTGIRGNGIFKGIMFFPFLVNGIAIG